MLIPKEDWAWAMRAHHRKPGMENRQPCLSWNLSAPLRSGSERGCSARRWKTGSLKTEPQSLRPTEGGRCGAEKSVTRSWTGSWPAHLALVVMSATSLGSTDRHDCLCLPEPGSRPKEPLPFGSPELPFGRRERSDAITASYQRIRPGWPRILGLSEE
jgi:hypothetical protein